MSIVSTTVSPSVTIVVAALPFLGIVALLVVRRLRHRRRAAAIRRDEEDFELVFPEGPDDQPVRKTTVGRRIARR
jgi:hypothetical protein